MILLLVPGIIISLTGSLFFYLHIIKCLYSDTEDNSDEQLNLPKMDSGIIIDNELYIRRTQGDRVARLVDSAVDIIDNDDDKNSRKYKKVVEAVKEREKEDKERLSRKERREVNTPSPVIKLELHKRKYT